MNLLAAGLCTSLGGWWTTVAALRAGLRRSRRAPHLPPQDIGEDADPPIIHPVREPDDIRQPGPWLELALAAYADLRRHGTPDPSWPVQVLLPEDDPARFGALTEDEGDPAALLAAGLTETLGHPCVVHRTGAAGIAPLLRRPGLVLAVDSLLDPDSRAWRLEQGRTEALSEAAVWLLVGDGIGPRLHANSDRPEASPRARGAAWHRCLPDATPADHWTHLCDQPRQLAWGHAAAMLGDTWPAGELTIDLGDALGDPGAAAGALAIACAALAQQRGWAAHPHSVVWIMSDDGTVAAIDVA